MSHDKARTAEDIDYSKVRVLTNHDAQLLQVGDTIESFSKPGFYNVVVDYKRKRTRSGESSEVHLDNGYVFDPKNQKREELRRMTILRPLAKFRPSVRIPHGVIPQQAVE